MIRFDKVSKTFRRQKVLDELSLNIAPDDRLALIGSNGAGKTTMIRCLLGEYIHEGQVVVDGLDTRKHRTEVLKNVGFVPQLPPPLQVDCPKMYDRDKMFCPCRKWSERNQRLRLWQ